MRKTLFLIAALSLASCGTVYQSQRVVSRASDDLKVRVVPMTSQSVLVANRSAYEPKDLPEVFRTTAGMGSGLRGNGAIPEPAYTAQTRPNSLETRLPPVTNPQPYTIGIGDVVLLATPSGNSVEELAGLLAAQNSRQGYTVQDDGAIAIPDVGRVSIAGMTIEEAEDTLFQRLIDAQIEPTFSLEIASFNSKKVAIGGAVNNPGVLPITLTPLYLEAALANRGGITATDMEYTSVRLYRDGTIYQIPLDTLYSQDNLNRILLQPGDSVFVDDAYQLDQAAAYFDQQIRLATYRQNARSEALNQLQTEVSLRRSMLQEQRENYAAQVDYDAVERDYVYLTGEVDQQGRFPLPLGRSATLADALYSGGGGLSVSTADPRHIYVLRGSDDPMEFDALTAWNLDAKNAASMTLATRFELRPNDIVFIAEQPVTRWQRTINQITPSIINLGTATVSN
ncbi:polysaccharide biosynthesis/export family protein [Celeribacter litoreus]|uniref:polysaccharide biosynthesis/export family protein n=1 Tax=Celeribacter litoreus TaxID=2876714 RepID=UPI001CCD2D25|nr:polysaccharide biosynthesis/export family protein [Celeribacter litoreus]MCA0044266.1 polysaccharide biosynthesis/export family protein [Celeribacter litoreus]